MSSPNPEAVATFHETRFEGERGFQLFENVIRVEGKQFLKPAFATNIPLEVLRPERETIEVRGLMFRFGMWITIGAAILAKIASLNVPQFGEIASKVALAMWMLAFAGSVMLCLGFPKFTVVRFKSEEETASLDIAKTGKQKKQFDAFVDAVEAQIRKVRAAKP